MATQRELAEHLDLHPTTVSELIKKGVIPAGIGKSNVNIDVCRIAYINHLRKAARYTKRDGTGDVQEEKARLTKAQADERELIVAKLRGDLLDANDVQRLWSDYAANVRSKLLSLPTKAAHHVLAAENFAEAEKVLKEIVYEALQELVEDGIPRELDESPEGSESSMDTTTRSDNK